MIRLLIISLLFIGVSCSKDPALFKLDNLNNNMISCFGHAGMGSRSIYPVNTYESLESCLNRGADGTEMDIQVTKDSVLVIFHEQNISNSTSCSGVIRDLNWEDISGCYMKSKLFKHLQLISFDEFIQKIPNPHDYTFTLDCKSGISEELKEAYFKLFARTIVRTIEKYDLDGNIFIENLETRFLKEIKNLKSNAKVFFLASDFEGGMKEALQYGLYGLSMHHSKITKDQIKIAHQNNLRVTLYGV